jgi:hypothetical protein
LEMFGAANRHGMCRLSVCAEQMIVGIRKKARASKMYGRTQL